MSLLFQGRDTAIPVSLCCTKFETKNIREYSSGEQMEYHREVQIIFQNPYNSLNPRQRVGSMLREIFRNLAHPYTKALLSAIPIPGPKSGRKHIILSGEIPSLTQILPRLPLLLPLQQAYGCLQKLFAPAEDRNAAGDALLAV